MRRFFLIITFIYSEILSIYTLDKKYALTIKEKHAGFERIDSNSDFQNIRIKNGILSSQGIKICGSYFSSLLSVCKTAQTKSKFDLIYTSKDKVQLRMGSEYTLSIGKYNPNTNMYDAILVPIKHLSLRKTLFKIQFKE